MARHSINGIDHYYHVPFAHKLMAITAATAVALVWLVMLLICRQLIVPAQCLLTVAPTGEQPSNDRPIIGESFSPPSVWNRNGIVLFSRKRRSKVAARKEEFRG